MKIRTVNLKKMSFDWSLFHQFVLLLFLYEDILRCKINLVLQIIKMIIHCFTLWSFVCVREQTLLFYSPVSPKTPKLSTAAQRLKFGHMMSVKSHFMKMFQRWELLWSFLLLCVDTLWLLLATLTFLLNENIILTQRMMHYDTDHQ